VLAGVFTVAGVAGAAFWVSHPSRSGERLAIDPQQNVLLVTIDTLRADALGCYGGPARTPS